jgi:mitochondrial translocator assembly and maintenance protein 41
MTFLGSELREAYRLTSSLLARPRLDFEKRVTTSPCVACSRSFTSARVLARSIHAVQPRRSQASVLIAVQYGCRSRIVASDGSVWRRAFTRPTSARAESSQSERTSSTLGQDGTSSFPSSTFPKHFGENQLVPIEPSTETRLRKILSLFDHPSLPIRFAMAYGSGVFSQEKAGPEHSKRPASKASGKKMVDLILAVQHPEHWHAMNMTQNASHYSMLARSGGSVILGWVQRIGAGIWYHPYVSIDDEMVKYGVISIDTLCEDLIDWDTLYVSGRMHKPVALLTEDARVRLAQQVNLASALRVALLILPEEFTEVELYTRIASLSYTGDFRMSVPGGENTNKVRNIVLNQREEFRRLYAGLMRSLGTLRLVETRSDRFSVVQDRSEDVRAEYAAKVPLRLRERIQEHYLRHPTRDPAFARLANSREDTDAIRKPNLEEDYKEFWKAVVRQQDFENVMLTNIAGIVKGPAWSQSLKGIYTAGLGRTWKYVMAKAGKWFEGRKEGSEKETLL